MISDEYKVCSRCALDKPRDQFAPRHANPQWVNSYCIECTTTKKTRDKRALLEQGLQTCDKCLKELPLEEFTVNKTSFSGRNWSCKACVRKHYTYKKYKMTHEEYELTFKAQGGVCRICRQSNDGKVLVVDHDRSCCDKTGSCGRCVRGLLCNRCNSLLGYAKDSIETLEHAIYYLENWKTWP